MENTQNLSETFVTKPGPYVVMTYLVEPIPGVHILTCVKLTLIEGGSLAN
jgi:hypothetical protein